MAMISGGKFPRRRPGHIVLDTILETRDDLGGVLRLRHRWEAHDAKILLTDETVIRIQRTAAGIFLDYDIRLRATHGAVTLGATEEGTMAVRMNEALRVTRGKNKDKRPAPAHSSMQPVTAAFPFGESVRRGATPQDHWLTVAWWASACSTI
jgi:hypothetical protein